MTGNENIEEENRNIRDKRRNGKEAIRKNSKIDEGSKKTGQGTQPSRVYRGLHEAKTKIITLEKGSKKKDQTIEKLRASLREATNDNFHHRR